MRFGGKKGKSRGFGNFGWDDQSGRSCEGGTYGVSAPLPAAAACDCGTEKPVSILGLYSVSQPAPTSPPISAGSVLQL